MFLRQTIECFLRSRLIAKFYFLQVYIHTLNDYFMYHSFKIEFNRFSKFLKLDYYITWLHYLCGKDYLNKSVHIEENFKPRFHSNQCKICQEI